MFSEIFQRFMEQSPAPVMVQVVLKRALSAKKLNMIFERATDAQYTRTLLFFWIFQFIQLVVFKTFPSVKAAYKEKDKQIGVSISSVYNKLNGLGSKISAALVREKAQIIAASDVVRQPWLPGYRIKVRDGNCIEASEHHLEALRETKAGALPGKSLVVYDLALEMATDVFLCEDGHAQERSLLEKVLPTVNKREAWITDRNFCVRSFLLGITEKGGYFICREHQGLSWEALGSAKYAGKSGSVKLYEQWIQICDDQGKAHKYRRIIVRLKTATRGGDTELFVLTNLPKSVTKAKLFARLYQRRWHIETMFQELEAHLHSEINTLGYPKAALFGFFVSLVAYNVLAVVNAALSTIHGEETIDNELSGYYLAGNIALNP